MALGCNSPSSFESSSKNLQPTPHLYVCKLKKENGKNVKVYVPSICQSFASFPVQTALDVQLGFGIQWIGNSETVPIFSNLRRIWLLLNLCHFLRFGPEGFCGGHEIFWAYIDGPLNIFQNFWWAMKYFCMSYFHNFIF